MQLTIDVPDKQLLEKILWFLNRFKSDGLKIVTQKQKSDEDPTNKPTLNNSIKHVKKLRGVGKELYHDINSDIYIKELRSEW